MSVADVRKSMRVPRVARDRQAQALARAEELRRRAAQITEALAALEADLVDVGASEAIIQETRQSLLAKLTPSKKQQTGPAIGDKPVQ